MATTPTNNGDLERDIVIHRERLDRDLADLQSRLSPGQLLDEGLAYLRRNQGGEFFHNLGESVRERPLPVALVGVGLAWLAMGGPGAGPTGAAGTMSRRPADHHDEGPGIVSRAWEAGRGVVRQAGESDSAYRERALHARAQVMGVARQAGEALEAFRDRVEDAMHAARDQVAGTAGAGYGYAADATRAGYERAKDYSGRAADTASRTAGAVGRTTSDLAGMIGDSPLLLGAVGMMTGALLGAIIPRTQTEEEMLEPLAGRTADAARNLAAEAMRRGERVARAAGQAGMEAVNDVAGEANKVAGEASRQAEGAAKDVAGAAGKSSGDGNRPPDRSTGRRDAPPPPSGSVLSGGTAPGSSPQPR